MTRALFRLLKRLGMSQRQIAGLTGQSQSEVSDILLKGRQVVNVLVLRRIADGLGISRERMLLGYGKKGPQAPSTEQKVDEKVERRTLIAAALRESLLNLRGEPITLGLPTDEPLPSLLSMTHVHEVRTATDQLVGRARYYGGQAGSFAGTVRRYTRWLEVPAPDEVTAHRYAPSPRG